MTDESAMPTEIVFREPSTMTPLMPMATIGQAVAGGASIEAIERLMSLQERWQAGENKRKFDEAMANARAEIKPIIKTRKAGFDSSRGGARTEYDYEDLAAIADTIDPVLAKHGLSYRYRGQQDGMMLSVTCIVFGHGHEIETTLTAGNDTSGSKNPIQAVGSTATYLERYTLRMAFGLSVTKDDDGHGGNGNGSQRPLMRRNSGI